MGDSYGINQVDVFMAPFYTQYHQHPEQSTYVFYADQTILNFGPYLNKRVYFTHQLPSSTPFPAPLGTLPAIYIGHTSQQLWNLYGVAIGGQLAPATAYSVPGIVGVIAPL